MSSSKKDEKKATGISEKNLVASETSNAAIEPGPIAELIEVSEPIKIAKPNQNQKSRDPRLPEVGTPITKTWKGHQILVSETPEGMFNVTMDGVDLGTGKSLTKAAKIAMAQEKIDTSVNGYFWFQVGTPEKVARTKSNRSRENLIAKITKLETKYQASIDRGAQILKNLDIAKAELETAYPIAETEPA